MGSRSVRLFVFCRIFVDCGVSVFDEGRGFIVLLVIGFWKEKG